MIDTQAIRSKILDLAMHGKFSVQDENETVDFCYEITADIPYVIPPNWKWVTIGSIITKDVGGGTPSKSVDEYWKNGTIPWMSVKDFSSARNGVLEDTIDHITQEGLENSASNLIGIDAIIICMRMALGKIVKLKQPMAINQDLRAIWLNSCVDRDYFVFYYSTLKVEGHGMTVAGINKKQLMAYMMPLPPLAEQQRIVERIERAFSILDTIDILQTQYADNRTALKSKLIDAAIQGELTEQLPEDGTAEDLYQQIQVEKQELIKAGKIKRDKPLPDITEEEFSFEIPDSWKMCRLGSIITLVSGTDYKPEEYNDENRGTPYITGASNLLPDGVLINRWTETPRCIANTGDVLLVCKGSGYGKVAMCDVEEAHIARQIMAIKKTELLDMRYILYFLTANFGYLKGKGQGLIPGVDRNSVLSMVFPLPPLAEQVRIVATLDELVGLIET